MKPLITGAAAGLGIALVLGAVSYMTPIGMTNFFLIAGLLGALALIPLFVRAFRSESMPTPQIFGTSAPGKMTTVSKSEAKGVRDEGSAVSDRTAAAAGAGMAMLAVVLIGALVLYA
ncbi:hypothetical protein CR205_12830 [Alteribacter lacisalsi]|uniref:Uncharacterized protein n=1 Tax=Alteribacter lacisalsi TaxID=2045244 RepID=A0A2W0HIG2_9BACI|nr:hypothetical protein [Alteribacter lacisalsi]PYZ96589.1 hypothetical protein CR205_12830 [Alteribacter lacisalsi]